MLAAMSWWSTLARAAGRGGSRAATIGYGTAAMPSARTAWPTTQEPTVLLPVRSHLVTRSASSRSPSVTVPKIVFLGPPGVGKGTYAKRIAKWLGVPHVAVGDLIRNEVKAGTPLGKEVENTVSSGGLVSDDVVLGLLKGFLEESCGASGSASATQVLHGKTIDASGGYILDGFPRTAKQAEMLSEFQGVNLVLNLYLREDVLIEKCLGRRICPECNGNYNVADIYRPAENGKPEIVMPPLSVPEGCKGKVVTRKDDTEEVVLNRLEIYRRESEPLEAYYRERGLLVDFEITGGIDHTLPVLSPTVIRELRQ